MCWLISGSVGKPNSVSEHLPSAGLWREVRGQKPRPRPGAGAPYYPVGLCPNPNLTSILHTLHFLSFHSKPLSKAEIHIFVSIMILTPKQAKLPSFSISLQTSAWILTWPLHYWGKANPRKKKISKCGNTKDLPMPRLRGRAIWLLRNLSSGRLLVLSGSREDRGAMPHPELVACTPPRLTSAPIPPSPPPYLSDLKKKKHFPRAQWGLSFLEYTCLKHLRTGVLPAG